ncbi:MAG: hypothetical protein C0592_03575 [Marinilabiliales bacterium]|nr:MAG: hypothetical protein C0592_03575 [Marinilabiliales bacterium]
MRKLVLIISIILLGSAYGQAQQTAETKSNTNSKEVRSQAPDQNTERNLQRHNAMQSVPEAERTTEMTKIGQVDTNLTTSPRFLGWDTIITPTMRYYPPPRPE